MPRDVAGDRTRARRAGCRRAGAAASLVAAALSRPTRDLIVRAVAPEDDDAAGLLEAEEAGVLVAEADSVRFTHPLLASAIYGGASAERRRRLHERLADVVSDPEERARHLALSTTEPDEAVAAELERAGARAATRGAQEAAAELFAGACRLTPDGLSEERARRELARRPPSGRWATSREAGRSPRLPPSAPPGRSGRERCCCWATSPGSWGIPARSRGSSTRWKLPRATLGLLAQIHAKLVNVSVALDPAGLLDRARAAAETIDPERDPAPAASVYLDLVWAETLRGHGEQRELLERWRACEERAGPDAPKNLFALIYFWCVDDFEAVRARYAVEERWYRERGEDVWRAERLAHISRAELAAETGMRRAARRGGLRDDRPARDAGAVGWPFRVRAIVDAHRGRVERARATLCAGRAGGARGAPGGRRSGCRASRSSSTRPETTPRSIAR